MRILKLGDIAKIVAGSSAPKDELFSEHEGIPFIRAGHLQDLCSGKSLSELPKIKDDRAKGLVQVPKGTILFAKSGMSCLKGRVYKTTSSSYIVNHLAGVICSDKVKPDYLKYYLKYYKPNRLVLDSSYPSIRLSDIENIKVIIPTLEKQIKIASMLNNAQELIDKRKAQIEDLDELVKSRFIEMFGDPLINNKGFSKIKIKDVIDTKILKASKVYKGDEQISYIDISCIDNLSNKIISHNEYLFREAPSRAQQCIEKDDILISTVRPNLRNVAMVEDVFENMVATSGVTVLRSNKINKYFLYKYVLSEYFTNEMVAVTSGANYPAIKSSDIYNHEIIYPPIEMQNEFAKFFKRVDKLKFEMEQSLKELEDNFNSLMQRAFKGELFN